MTSHEDEGTESTVERTLVVYSGPTSMDRNVGKNGMYIDNLSYFLEQIACDDGDVSIDGNDDAPAVSVNYVFVFTAEVDGYYTSPDGPITKKIQECKAGSDSSFIKVLVREDRCYDMESIRMVISTMNAVREMYDNLVFLNSGMAGPRIGEGSPDIPSHWTQIYTSRLSDEIALVGHTINTHMNVFFRPHVQSFLYAIRTETIPILLDSGAIYDCGQSQEELETRPEKREELIERYEVGMSTELLKRGYKIATAFLDRYEFGRTLVFDSESTWGTELDPRDSDIWYEDGIRSLTATLPQTTPKWWTAGEVDSQTLRGSDADSFEQHKYDILPFDYYLFFKVSRFVPEDIQQIIGYDPDELRANGVMIIPNGSSEWLERRRQHFSVASLLLVLLVLFAFVSSVKKGMPRVLCQLTKLKSRHLRR